MTGKDQERKEAIRYIENQIRDGYIDLNSLDEVEMDIITCALKQYEQQKWIPCGERLPEHTGFYLIQHSRECCADEMAVAFYSVEEHEIDPDDCWEFSSVGDVQEVIAWMPLPEPYKEREDE